MRSSLLTSLALACGVLALPFAAKAVPIRVGLLGASGGTTWTSLPVGGGPTPSFTTDRAAPSAGLGTVSLSGWEIDSGVWSPATMNQNPDMQGLGVQCNSPLDPTCTGNQIGSNPAQIIDLNISQLTGWTSLLITIDSVTGTNTGNLYGKTCAPGGDCATLLFRSCTASARGSCTFTLTSLELADITDLWITPVAFDPILLDGNLYVCTGAGPCVKPTSVPEPAALGMFGLGLLLIGTFVGLRRRRFGD